MNTARRVMVGLIVALAAGRCAAQSAGSVWSLGPDGQVQSQVGTWQAERGQAQFQPFSSLAPLGVNLLQPTASSTRDFYIYRMYTLTPVQRASNSFNRTHPMVGPPRPIYGYRRNPTDGQLTAEGELVLNLRTYTGQSIDGAWRSIETPRVSRYTTIVTPTASPWQPLRFYLDTAGPASTNGARQVSSRN